MNLRQTKMRCPADLEAVTGHLEEPLISKVKIWFNLQVAEVSTEMTDSGLRFLPLRMAYHVRVSFLLLCSLRLILRDHFW